MSLPDEHHSSSSSSSSSSSHHHHHHHSSSGRKHHHHGDDSDRFKRRGLSSIKRRRIMEKVTFWTLTLIAIGVVAYMIYVYKYMPAIHYK